MSIEWLVGIPFVALAVALIVGPAVAAAARRRRPVVDAPPEAILDVFFDPAVSRAEAVARTAAHDGARVDRRDDDGRNAWAPLRVTSSRGLTSPGDGAVEGVGPSGARVCARCGRVELSVADPASAFEEMVREGGARRVQNDQRAPTNDGPTTSAGADARGRGAGEAP